MGAETIVIYTTGVAGSGKTYTRCARFLCDELLPETDKKLICNYPLYIPKIAEFVAARYSMTREKLLERMEIIPHEVLESWRLAESGPWEYFKARDIKNTHIAIDEIHNFCGKHQHKDHRRAWQLWLGEIRHRGATIEFLTQNPHKVAKELDYECGLRYRIENCENIRDPILGITCSDWYELRAAFFTNRYVPTIHQIESVNRDGKWCFSQEKTYTLDPQYFQFYDSFSAPVAGGNKAEGKQYDFQKYSKAGLLARVAFRNGGPLAWRIMVGVLLCWLLFFGGINQMLGRLQSALVSAGGNRSKVTSNAKSAKTAVASGSAKVPTKVPPTAKPIGPVIQESESNTLAKALQLSLPLAGSNPAKIVSIPIPKIPVVSSAALPAPMATPFASPVPVLKDNETILCVGAWDQGAFLADFGSVLKGDVVNGYRVEACTPRGPVINGVLCRVGVRTKVASPAAVPGPGHNASTPAGGGNQR
jgi:hypothetical protein